MRPQDVVIILAILADWQKIRRWRESETKSLSEREVSEENGGIKFGAPIPFANIPVTNKEMAYNLQISESEISESLRRSEYSGLISNVESKSVNKLAFLDFLIYGLKYVFPAKPSGIGRGFATAHSAPPLNEKIVSEENYIWEHAQGNTRGLIIEPLFKTVPNILEHNPILYELLSLTDGIRTGNSRVFSLSVELLKSKLLE